MPLRPILKNGHFTTVCEHRICVKIRGVKFWSTYPLFGPETVQNDLKTLSDADISGIVFTSQLHFFDKTAKFLEKLESLKNDEIISNLSNDYQISIKLTGTTSKLTKLLSSNDSPVLDLSKHPLIMVSREVFDSDEITLDGAQWALLVNKKDVRDYEQIFHDFKNKGGFMVVIDIEIATRGHIALANKFGLKSMVENVMYERHIEKAKTLNCDHTVYGQID